MTRGARTVFLAALLGIALLATGCQRKVEVETGTRVVCSYGHTISDDVRTEKVPVKEAVDHYIRTEVKTCDKHAQAERLYMEAQAAIDSGDLKLAREKLAQVVALDKSFGSARAQLADIDSNQKPGVDDGSGAPNDSGDEADAGDDPASTPTGKLSVWMPATLKGYNGSKLILDVFTATRDYRPTSGETVSLMVIIAEQQRTPIGANALMGKMVKQPCPYDATTVTVKGRKAYFGTDNKRLATLAFTEGPVMVAIQMASKQQGKPEALKADLVGVASQLP